MSSADIVTIAGKDLRTALHRRAIRLSLTLFPIITAIGLSLVLRGAGAKSGGAIPPDILSRLLLSFLFFFVIGASSLPTAIAAYSFVGEKIERSLEPLLATPVTDLDVLLGKSLAAFVPPVVVTWFGGALFIVLANREVGRSGATTGLPNPTAWIILGLVIPLSALLSVFVSVLVSVRATDTRSAQQAAGLLALPFAAIYVLSEIQIISLDPPGMLTLAGIIAAVDMVLFVLARAAFNREEILTRWR
ncbi:MAG: ABC transporter permease [Intrasporangium sp.]|uniref:ABC transporter permease n=1 Tax=Intrasporangium sp. TaxID=1925024 RepID=UPI003F81C41E